MNYFSSIGRRIPYDGIRVYNKIPSQYYKLKQPEINYNEILNRLKLQGIVPKKYSSINFENKAKSILKVIENNENYRNILNGVSVPFIISNNLILTDLGENLESYFLPKVQNTFIELYPQSNFKAILQSDAKLQNKIKIASNSNYENFIETTKNSTVVGWYFPQALQEFDVDSQRRQMTTLPQLQGVNVCLSGGIDICAALMSCPQLLISDDFYTPILCMSSYEHSDSRMVLLIKAYGPHLEFWCMTQMLTSTSRQVSEQWAGGLCIYSSEV
jgi:hypothetical protein